jgi:hypothetical protein
MQSQALPLATQISSNHVDRRGTLSSTAARELAYLDPSHYPNVCVSLGKLPFAVPFAKVVRWPNQVARAAFANAGPKGSGCAVLAKHLLIVQLQLYRARMLKISVAAADTWLLSVGGLAPAPVLVVPAQDIAQAQAGAIGAPGVQAPARAGHRKRNHLDEAMQPEVDLDLGDDSSSN